MVVLKSFCLAVRLFVSEQSVTDGRTFFSIPKFLRTFFNKFEQFYILLYLVSRPIKIRSHKIRTPLSAPHSTPFSQNHIKS